jgi:hypothetical protein
MIRLHRIAPVAALLFAATAQAAEYTRFQALLVTPAARPGEAAGCTSLALLNLPPAWRAGDAAVVMLAPWQTADAARSRLVAAVLHEHAAVLELSVAPCPGAEPAEPVDALPEALGALAALRHDVGAGVVVAIGYGPGARRMLDAVGEGEAQARLGSAGPRFAAAVAFGEGAPAFAVGAAQAPTEQAPARLGLLCDALGSVARDLAEALRAAPEATAAACRVTLAAAPATRAAFRD